MTTKRMTYQATPEVLDFLNLLGNPWVPDHEFTFSNSVSMSATTLQMLICSTKLRITSGELLYCCAVMNGGTHLTQFDMPSVAAIDAGIDSMIFGLKDGFTYESENAKQFGVTAEEFIPKLDRMDLLELITLAFATCHFWKAGKLGSIAGLKNPSDCKNWGEWTSQFIEAATKKVKIVWNNCDGYIELDEAKTQGYEIDGYTLIGRTQSSTAFDVVECSIDDVPVDEDGEKNFEGFYLTEAGRVYKDE